MITFRRTFNSEFSYTEAWFTNQSSELLDIEIKLTLVMN